MLCQSIIALAGATLLTVLHLRLIKRDIQTMLCRWCETEKTVSQHIQQPLLNKSLLEAKTKMLRSLSKMGLHVTFVLALAGLWNLIHHPSFASLTQFLPCLLGYALSLLMESGILRISTEDEFLFCEALSVFMHLCFVLGVVDESDLATFVITGQLATGGTFFLAVTFMDLQVLLPLYACEATVLTWKLWRLIGFENLTPMLVCATVVSHLLLSSTFAFMVSSMRSKIAARQDSHDATSMLHGFRQVLRSVCDGGLVLDRQNCQIVDGANCLERLLASNKSLANTNFLDLFLDAEARQRFLQFLSEDAKGAECEDARIHSNPAMPLGLRVSLQGARGPVSLDLFCTSGSISGPTGNDLCLLAIKEDAEQIAPDAPPDSVPPMSSIRQGLRFPSTRSTLSELVEAYDELTQVALLVSNNTGFMDIEEAHLSFKRQSPALTIEQGMPTLRRFIRPSDWDRIEGMFTFVANLPAYERQRCYFRKPMLFRIPGESRSYLRSKETCVSRAEDAGETSGAMHFWMYFTDFDSTQVLRPREQELPGIHEKTWRSQEELEGKHTRGIRYPKISCR